MPYSGRRILISNPKTNNLRKVSTQVSDNKREAVVDLDEEFNESTVNIEEDEPEKGLCKHETFISTRDILAKEDNVSDSYKDILNIRFNYVRRTGYYLTMSYLTLLVYGFLLGSTGFYMLDILGIPLVIIGFILIYIANKSNKKELADWLKTITLSKRITLFDAEDQMKKKKHK